VLGKIGGMLPTHKGPIVLKDGVTIGFTVTTNEVVETHVPLLAVKI
jgi:hypothetical protein